MIPCPCFSTSKINRVLVTLPLTLYSVCLPPPSHSILCAALYSVLCTLFVFPLPLALYSVLFCTLSSVLSLSSPSLSPSTLFVLPLPLTLYSVCLPPHSQSVLCFVFPPDCSLSVPAVLCVCPSSKGPSLPAKPRQLCQGRLLSLLKVTVTVAVL